MSRLLETIKCLNGRIYNLEYHQKRFNRARKTLFNQNDFLSLQDEIAQNQIPENGLYRLRILYQEKIEKIEWIGYQKKMIHSLQCVIDDRLSYNYKWEDRRDFEKLLLKKNNADEILIIQNGRLTDTSFSNIALYDGKKWLTPSKPLLEGTKRAKLLDEGLIFEEEIFLKDLKHFKRISLINAMLDLEESMIPAGRICTQI
ncbi:MAG TPA: hypothetical protein DHW82_13760 [Spirochaetia bacterium]|nr:MAG: hypothetical protein A2Y41_09275 [Spirochaetes bacterium GWB1_36_13]HCL58056.1 hypothetical protein [Spirochaetia bacterium]